MHTPYYVTDTHFKTLTNETHPEDQTGSVMDLWAIYRILYATAMKTAPVILVVILNIVLIKRLRVVWRRRKRISESVSCLSIAFVCFIDGLHEERKVDISSF